MAYYRTIHTTVGLAAMAQAEATGTPINLTHMAVGDGNGNAVMPSESQTTLVREMYRSTVNRVFQDPAQINKFTAELVVPATVGGFVLREVGIFDSNGSLFAVGNLPESYKPQSSEGAFSDTIVRMEFMVTNSSVVTILVDPNVALASQSWVLNNVTIAGLIPGGTTGQILAKDSNADGDYIWKDPTEANVVVNAIEEQQTLVAAQTSVILSTLTTEGLAVYIEGVRIPRVVGSGGWQPDVGDTETTIVLGQSYPAGTKILLVQNDPLGGVATPLSRDLNLADVPDKAVARSNLDVFSKAEARQLAPVGQVSYFATGAAPTGWLKANGAAVSRVAYSDLYAAIGTTFGGGDGFNNFNLPDLRGEFLRGLDDGRGVDAGRAIGSSQSDQNKDHNHSASTDTAGSHTHTYVDTDTDPGPGLQGGPNFFDRSTVRNTSAAGAHSHSVTVGSSGGNEARPRNVALLACIKF